MSMSEDPHTWSGALVRNNDGAALGRVGGVYFHSTTGRATWAEVSDGVGTAMVPLDHVVLDRDGLCLPYRVEQLASAPRHDLGGYLDPEAERALYRHYGLAPADSSTDTPQTPDTPEVAAPAAVDTAADATVADTTDANPPALQPADAAPVVAVPTESRSGDPVEWVRSEEQLRVSVQRRVYGRARLVTYLVTENQTFTVPVTRQEVRLEPVPVDETERSESDGSVGELVEDEYELVLHREEVSFTKAVVPSERVRLVRRIVAGEQPITTQLRHEEIDLARTDADVDPEAKTPIRGIAQVTPSSVPSES